MNCFSILDTFGNDKDKYDQTYKSVDREDIEKGT